MRARLSAGCACGAPAARGFACSASPAPGWIAMAPRGGTLRAVSRFAR
ncbi:MAG TPA: hypothetical protein VIH93_00235 [Thermoanaerobaculia bacterium]